MRETIRVGMIGCGRIADMHWRGIQAHPKAELHALCDASTQILEKRAAEWNVARTTTDYRDLLAASDIDAVVILTPHHLHCTQVVEALEAGKHTAIEKPVALKLKEVDRMLAATAASGKICQCCDNYCFYPPYRTAADIIKSGAIGDPVSFRFSFCRGDFHYGWSPVALDSWREDPSKSGGGWLTFDVGFHIYSLMHLLIGPAGTVHVWPPVEPGNPAREQPYIITWTSADYPGFYGLYESVNAPELYINTDQYPVRDQLEVYGTKGNLLVPTHSKSFRSGSPLEVYVDGHNTQYDDLDNRWEAGFINEVANFFEAIKGTAQPRWSLEESRKVLQMALAVEQAARTGGDVEVASIA